MFTMSLRHWYLMVLCLGCNGVAMRLGTHRVKAVITQPLSTNHYSKEKLFGLYFCVAPTSVCFIGHYGKLSKLPYFRSSPYYFENNRNMSDRLSISFHSFFTSFGAKFQHAIWSRWGYCPFFLRFPMLVCNVRSNVGRLSRRQTTLVCLAAYHRSQLNAIIAILSLRDGIWRMAVAE